MEVLPGLRGDIETLLATSAQLVQADRGQGADQGESSDERQDQRQQVIFEHESEKKETHDRIYYDKENCEGWHGHEVVETLGQSVSQVRRTDPADTRVRRA